MSIDEKIIDIVAVAISGAPFPTASSQKKADRAIKAYESAKKQCEEPGAENRTGAQETGVSRTETGQPVELSQITEAKHQIGTFANIHPEERPLMTFGLLLKCLWRLHGARETMGYRCAEILAGLLDSLPERESGYRDYRRVVCAKFWKAEYCSLARAGVEKMAELGLEVDPAERMIEAAEYRQSKLPAWEVDVDREDIEALIISYDHAVNQGLGIHAIGAQVNSLRDMLNDIEGQS